MSAQNITFDGILDKIRRESKNTAELGTKFEKITKDFLEVDSLYVGRFKKVYLWKQWPKRDGIDTGIDLVAEQRDGTECAIQCKCYADDGSIDTKSVAKFLAKASSLKIPHTILVYTGDSITSNAIKILRDSRTQIIRSETFRISSINWNNFPKIHRIKNPKILRPHQENAVSDVIAGLKKHDRGKMIMACGTGKTLTSLHIAEKQSGLGGIVLYAVPSISLILQSMREWLENANIKHNYMAVCSDKSTGEDASITELESPVSTDVKTLRPYISNRPKDAMTVIFSTYHSIEVVKDATKGISFDVIFCDEAHRTTGVEDKSFFTVIHKDSNIKGKKRLYMTATPRVYSDVIQARMGRVIYSMDDETKFGPDFHSLTFTEAVRQEILSDFRVKIAIVPADKVNAQFQQSVAGKDNSMPLDERTLLAAVWHGLSYPNDDVKPKLLQRVIAFANRIDRSMMFAGKINDENDINRSFANIVEQYEKKNKTGNRVDVEHIDGKTKALERRDKMRWLDDSDKDPHTCRILSNAKCLSEGVDIPALDGVIFLNPRKSRVDVVQSVGRVMRKSPGKDYGYVILPVAIPAGLEYHEALDDNSTFKIVWQVLNALRSHDENFGAEINRLVLSKDTENTNPTPRISVSVLDDTFQEKPRMEFFNKVKSKLVEKVGDIDYYDKYGKDIGHTAKNVENSIKSKLAKSPELQSHLDNFHQGLQQIINEDITKNESIQIIGQHIVMSRIFDMMFSGEFTTHNPISQILEKVSEKFGLQDELKKLEPFYVDARNEISKITTREARQSFIKKIYSNFFASASKEQTEQHGIVYTPVEIIDFIINSVQILLSKHFDTEFNRRDVTILEPFAGTGTFISRLLESGYITDNLYEKYKHDVFANEMILLAYYIATVNIETTYSSLRKGGRYVPFDGISYTDTIKQNSRYRQDKRHRQEPTRLNEDFAAVHKRTQHQKNSHLHVLIGNPPYSAGQNDYNKNAPNKKYPVLDERIKDTYVSSVKKINKDIQRIASLYDSYIRSLRWASDRIGKSGIIGFITNASFIRSETTAGLRACLEEEFDEIWCFDLRGNALTKGEIRKKEGGGIFGSGSKTPVSIIILVKKPKKQKCIIHYKDIGDYHSREKKLKIVKNSKSIGGINDWQIIISDKHHDWLNQRNDEFVQYTPMGSKKTKAGKGHAVFKMYSAGIKTNRDEWIYNSSKDELGKNMSRHIDYCNSQDLDNPNFDPTQGKWTEELAGRLQKTRPVFDKNKIRISLYRPFFKQMLYFDKIYIERIYRIPLFFPEKNSENLVICIAYKSAGEFSTIMTQIMPDIQVNYNGQCFPLYIYENGKKKENITKSTLQEYQKHYNSKKHNRTRYFLLCLRIITSYKI